MKVRFISDLHYYLNLDSEPTEFEHIMSQMEPADVTLIAGDLNCDTVEAMSFLQDISQMKEFFLSAVIILYAYINLEINLQFKM